MANAGLRAMYTGVDSIMSAFDSLRGTNPFYSVWYGRDMLYQYAGEDLDAGRVQLLEMLDAAEASGNTDILLIKFHPKVKGNYITNKTENTGTLPVRVVPLGEGHISGMDASSNGLLPSPVYHMFKRIDEHLTKPSAVDEVILARLGALELKEATPVEPEKTIVDHIKSVLEIPGVSDILTKLIEVGLPAISGIGKSNLMINGFPGNPALQQPETSMSEPIKDSMAISTDNNETVDFTDAENEIIDKALDDLSSYCNVVDILPKLAKFAAENKPTFDFVLAQLK